MRKRTTLVMLSFLMFAGVGIYRMRRQIIARWFKLTPVHHRFYVKRGRRIAMPDGISLAADLYHPAANDSFPTILIRCPYGRNAAAGPTGLLMEFMARRFAERGYNVVMQDVRGRYDSPGDFDPFRHEAADGRSTLEWIESQPWCNGKIGMWGPSYLGYAQWAVAPDAPASLKALFPVISGSQMPMTGMRDRAHGADTQMRWIRNLETSRRGSMMRRWMMIGTLVQKQEDQALHRASQVFHANEMDAAVIGYPVEFYRNWMSHPDPSDEYWQAVDAGRRIEDVRAAVHLMGGWYDLFTRETLDDYARLQQAGRRPYLTVGPWRHIDQAGLIESFRHSLAWFEAYLKDDHRRLRAKPVRLFVMGAGEWREMDAWPPPARPLVMYLAAGWRLAPISEPTEPGDAPAGDLPVAEGSPAPVDSPVTLPYDPTDPPPAIGGNMLSAHAGQIDNRLLEARPDVLTFTGPALEQPLEVIGYGKVTLFVRPGAPELDLFCRICDVHPNGASYNICDGFLRLHADVGYRQSDGSLRVEVPLWPSAYRFKKDHSIRLLISGGAHPRWVRSTAGAADETSLAPSEMKIYLDTEHPSQVELPQVLIIDEE